MNIPIKIAVLISVTIVIGTSVAILSSLFNTVLSEKIRYFIGAGLFASILLIWFIIFNKFIWNK